MRIGVDLDEVLCEFLSGLIDFHNSVYGSSLVFDDFFSYNFWEVWGGDVEEAKLKVFAFYESDFFKNLKPVKGAVEGVKALGEIHELFIITARQEFIADKTKVWLDLFFPGLFKGLIIVNHLSNSGVSRSKGDVCDELNISVMIEDSFGYAVDCLRNDRLVILFNKPWNVNKGIVKGIVRVNSWEDCVRVINSFK
ncbi:hypothetical protein KO361_01530 [Candidatus Woesearchaeota archaeon]|nr:hypothetical protein [Candidatus Woesearchaeota archaeon]